MAFVATESTPQQRPERTGAQRGSSNSGASGGGSTSADVPPPTPRTPPAPPTLARSKQNRPRAAAAAAAAAAASSAANTTLGITPISNTTATTTAVGTGSSPLQLRSSHHFSSSPASRHTRGGRQVLPTATPTATTGTAVPISARAGSPCSLEGPALPLSPFVTGFALMNAVPSSHLGSLLSPPSELSFASHHADAAGGEHGHTNAIPTTTAGADSAIGHNTSLSAVLCQQLSAIVGGNCNLSGGGSGCGNSSSSVIRRMAVPPRGVGPASSLSSLPPSQVSTTVAAPAGTIASATFGATPSLGALWQDGNGFSSDSTASAERYARAAPPPAVTVRKASQDGRHRSFSEFVRQQQSSMAEPAPTTTTTSAAIVALLTPPSSSLVDLFQTPSKGSQPRTVETTPVTKENATTSAPWQLTPTGQATRSLRPRLSPEHSARRSSTFELPSTISTSPLPSVGAAIDVGGPPSASVLISSTHAADCFTLGEHHRGSAALSFLTPGTSTAQPPPLLHAPHGSHPLPSPHTHQTNHQTSSGISSPMAAGASHGIHSSRGGSSHGDLCRLLPSSSLTSPHAAGVGGTSSSTTAMYTAATSTAAVVAGPISKSRGDRHRYDLSPATANTSTAATSSSSVSSRSRAQQPQRSTLATTGTTSTSSVNVAQPPQPHSPGFSGPLSLRRCRGIGSTCGTTVITGGGGGGGVNVELMAAATRRSSCSAAVSKQLSLGRCSPRPSRSHVNYRRSAAANNNSDTDSTIVEGNSTSSGVRSSRCYLATVAEPAVDPPRSASSRLHVPVDGRGSLGGNTVEKKAYIATLHKSESSPLDGCERHGSSPPPRRPQHTGAESRNDVASAGRALSPSEGRCDAATVMDSETGSSHTRLMGTSRSRRTSGTVSCTNSANDSIAASGGGDGGTGSEGSPMPASTARELLSGSSLAGGPPAAATQTGAVESGFCSCRPPKAPRAMARPVPAQPE